MQKIWKIIIEHKFNLWLYVRTSNSLEYCIIDIWHIYCFNQKAVDESGGYRRFKVC